MTPDERIEKLLNKAGNTMSDLPKPSETKYAYSAEHRVNAMKASVRYNDPSLADKFELISINDTINMFSDYVCHLADVIDRMETALHNTVNKLYPQKYVVRMKDRPEHVTGYFKKWLECTPMLTIDVATACEFENREAAEMVAKKLNDIREIVFDRKDPIWIVEEIPND